MCQEILIYHICIQFNCLTKVQQPTELNTLGNITNKKSLWQALCNKIKCGFGVVTCLAVVVLTSSLISELTLS